MKASRGALFGLLCTVASMSTGIIGCRHADLARKGLGASTPPIGQQGADPGALERVLVAERSRDEKAIPAEALSSRDVTLRRAAARALARIADDGAAPRLEKELGDEDPEVVMWSAYGLGYACSGREEATVRRLSTRAATLRADPSPIGEGKLFESAAIVALSDALGRCGGGLAERTLTAWIDGGGPRARAAVLGLGRIAGASHRLGDETIVAVLDHASLPGAPTAALYPIGRLESLSEAASKRLVEVARAALSLGGERRSFAIRALGTAGAAGIDLLADTFADESTSGADRALAATELGRIGAAAKPALLRALGRLVRADAPIDEHFVTKNFGPLVAALSTPLWPNPTAREPLSRLADAPLSDGMSGALRRRIVALRCGAAAALSGKASRAAKLVSCDPEPNGRSGALAELRVLDRGALDGARFERWQELASAKDPTVRRASLALVPIHPEMPAIVDLIARAIAAPEPGIAAQAARVIAIEPRRAWGGAFLEHAASPSSVGPSASPRVVDALAHAMDAERPLDQIEPRAAFMDAAAALGTLSLKSRIERYCSSENVTLRRRAEAALSLLGQAKFSCPPSKRALWTLPEDPPVVSKTVTVTFSTDAGRFAMTLDAVLAPLAVGRVVSLAKSGFYSGMRIHRVTPGFVAQFGDPVGDGSGGSGRPPIPCETSPVEFSAFSVGMALSGRDSGSSQIFVTLSPQPQLDGDYSAVGRADPEWANVAEGDVIQNVEVH